MSNVQQNPYSSQGQQHFGMSFNGEQQAAFKKLLTGMNPHELSINPLVVKADEDLPLFAQGVKQIVLGPSDMFHAPRLGLSKVVTNAVTTNAEGLPDPNITLLGSELPVTPFKWLAQSVLFSKFTPINGPGIFKAQA